MTILYEDATSGRYRANNSGNRYHFTMDRECACRVNRSPRVATVCARRYTSIGSGQRSFLEGGVRHGDVVIEASEQIKLSRNYDQHYAAARRVTDAVIDLSIGHYRMQSDEHAKQLDLL